MAFNFFFHWRAWASVHEESRTNNISWKDTKNRVGQFKNQVGQYRSEDQQLQDELKRLNKVGEEIVGSADGRLLWLELAKAITAALPKDGDAVIPLSEKSLSERREIYIESVESEYFPEVSDWFTTIQEKYNAQKADAASANGEATDGDPVPVAATPAPAPSGKGWIVQITGFHFQHGEKQGVGSEYVREYLIEPLETELLIFPNKWAANW